MKTDNMNETPVDIELVRQKNLYDSQGNTQKQKFDLYFAGTSYKELLEVAKVLNVCKLFSQLTERRDVNMWSEAFKSGKTTGKLFVDSGAYTAHTKGADLDANEYIDYLNSLGETVEIFAQMDVIPGVFNQKRSREDSLEAPRKTWENYLYMRDHINFPHKLLPIFHQGEDFKWLKNMLEWKDVNNRSIPYIGISAAKDLPVNLRESFYYKAFAMIHSSSNPNVKIHGFGTSSLRHLVKFPFTSTDATSWIMVAANGAVTTDIAPLLVSDKLLSRSSGKYKHNSKYIPQQVTYIESLCDKFGIDASMLSCSAKYRQLFNMLYLLNWTYTYEYEGPKIFKAKGLF